MRGGLGEAEQSDVDRLLDSIPALEERLAALVEAPIDAMKTRLHGDYHLGQVLVSKGDVYILDFEGEPARPMAERRAKTSPLKDVAGMLRSFDYAASALVDRFEQRDPTHLASVPPLAETWRQVARRQFVQAYREHIHGCQAVPHEMADFDRLLELFLIEKGIYEILYEAANRPKWVTIPVRGVLGLLDPEQRSGLFSDG
jgi:maltose alpha-D-glucosyltransferase/alpha-amylase